MAEGGSENSLEFLMECGICFEDFSLEGDHVPRILPCSHTLCEMCIRNILKRKPKDANLLECPMCKVKHPVSQGARSFPQNQFILPIIRKKMISFKTDEEMRKYVEHTAEPSLFSVMIPSAKKISAMFVCLKNTETITLWIY